MDQRRVGAIAREALVTLAEEDHPHALALDECQKSVALLCLFSPNEIRLHVYVSAPSAL